MGLQQFDEIKPRFFQNQILLANGTDQISLASDGQFPLRIDGVYFSNNDTIDHVATLAIDDSSGFTSGLGGVNVPAGAGYTLPAVDAFDNLLNHNQQFLTLPLGTFLKFNTTLAMVGTSFLGAVALGGVVVG